MLQYNLLYKTKKLFLFLLISRIYIIYNIFRKPFRLDYILLYSNKVSDEIFQKIVLIDFHEYFSRLPKPTADFVRIRPHSDVAIGDIVQVSKFKARGVFRQDPKIVSDITYKEHIGGFGLGVHEFGHEKSPK